MPTSKKRINITLSKDLEITIIKLAERDNVPVATKAMQLLNSAMEIEEDDFLDQLADKRTGRKSKYYSHTKAWS